MTEIANAASALVFRQTVVPILFQVVTQVKPQRLGIFAHRLELVPPKAVTLSGREQKEKGREAKRRKVFGGWDVSRDGGVEGPGGERGRTNPLDQGTRRRHAE